MFGADGRLIAVLDVSAIDPELSERAHALTRALTVRSARAIEERFFRGQFRREWIVAVAPPEGGGAGMLLAIDGNQRIVGANRVARTSLMLDDRGSGGVSACGRSSSETSTSSGVSTGPISLRDCRSPAAMTVGSRW